MLRLEQLRRQINTEARRSALQIIAGFVLAFVLGWTLGRFGR
jgi:hypothetical protein